MMFMVLTSQCSADLGVWHGRLATQTTDYGTYIPMEILTFLDGVDRAVLKG
jgi:hypothetical protein